MWRQWQYSVSNHSHSWKSCAFLPPALLPRALMYADKSLVQVGFEIREAALGSGGARDQHVVEAGMDLAGLERRRQCPEAPAHPVAQNRAADLLGNRVSEARRGFPLRDILSAAGLQNESGRAPAPAAPDP